MVTETNAIELLASRFELKRPSASGETDMGARGGYEQPRRSLKNE
jgi:hypothetical protein